MCSIILSIKACSVALDKVLNVNKTISMIQGVTVIITNHCQGENDVTRSTKLIIITVQLHVCVGVSPFAWNW